MQRQSPDNNPGQDEPTEAWDANDPRRRKDQFAPPTDACECFCLHCRRTFMSDGIWFQKINGARDGFDGFWMCPTPNCGGAGFTFDVFPTDPKHPANEGWFSTDGDEDESEGEWTADDHDAEGLSRQADDSEYDPDEPGYRMLDEMPDDSGDLDGEEWKFGLEPGERPESGKPAWVIEEEKKYDEPDQRPRELDWSDEDRPSKPMNEDDIPF